MATIKRNTMKRSYSEDEVLSSMKKLIITDENGSPNVCIKVFAEVPKTIPKPKPVKPSKSTQRVILTAFRNLAAKRERLLAQLKEYLTKELIIGSAQELYERYVDISNIYPYVEMIKNVWEEFEMSQDEIHDFDFDNKMLELAEFFYLVEKEWNQQSAESDKELGCCLEDFFEYDEFDDEPDDFVPFPVTSVSRKYRNSIHEYIYSISHDDERKRKSYVKQIEDPIPKIAKVEVSIAVETEKLMDDFLRNLKDIPKEKSITKKNLSSVMCQILKRQHFDSPTKKLIMA